jgi:hypothetical protein
MRQEIRCPSCEGSQFEVVSPGRLRCTSETITSAVPPGQGGNLSSAPIPIYGPCLTPYTQQQGVQAAARARERRAERQRQRDEEARFEAEQKDLEARKVEALAKLNALGNPGLVSRVVPGRYYLSLAREILGKRGEDELVETEGAWPVGMGTWTRSGPYGGWSEEELETGITPTGRLVPIGRLGRCRGDGVATRAGAG